MKSGKLKSENEMLQSVAKVSSGGPELILRSNKVLFISKIGSFNKVNTSDPIRMC